MTNPTPHGQVPEALRIADEFKLCSEFDSIPSIIDIEKAEAELRRQHAHIAELEAQIEALSGVQALSAAPAVPNGDELRRIARSARTSASDDASPTEYVLAGWKAAMRAASPTPPAEQSQPRYSHLHDADAVHGKRLSVYSKPTAEQQAATKAAPGELSDWKPLKTSKEGRDAVRSFFREKLKRHDFDEYIMKSLAADFACVLGGYLRAAPQQEAQEPVAISEAIERMADDRYKVVPSHESMFHRWAVVATGTQQLYLGREVECQNMARKFAGAFLDGAFVAMQQAAPQPAPLSDEVVKDAARWRMAVLIGNEVMMHPEKRTHAVAVKAYMDATHSGLDLTGAVDAALAAQKDTP